MFFFNDTATTEIYTLSLHDALPISSARASASPTTSSAQDERCSAADTAFSIHRRSIRSEEHTSELQSRQYLVCRLLLEKKTYFAARSRVSRVPTTIVADIQDNVCRC